MVTKNMKQPSIDQFSIQEFSSVDKNKNTLDIRTKFNNPKDLALNERTP